jgi:hypothetical protein
VSGKVICSQVRDTKKPRQIRAFRRLSSANPHRRRLSGKHRLKTSFRFFARKIRVIGDECTKFIFAFLPPLPLSAEENRKGEKKMNKPAKAKYTIDECYRNASAS